MKGFTHQEMPDVKIPMQELGGLRREGAYFQENNMVQRFSIQLATRK